tara:strand:- start:429 stop:662 length:234 start_codon:yes stop_codon:yes gene_type:complete
MKQKELQEQIKKDILKLGAKYREQGNEQELFFMAYVCENFLINMIKNIPATQTLIIFVNLLKNILQTLVDTYVDKKR